MKKPVGPARRMPVVGSKLAVVVAVVFLAGAGGGPRAGGTGGTAGLGAGDAFTIVLADAGGSPVKHLDPGAYSLVVHDHSSFHNFHLSGPGVDVTTDVDAIGDRTFTVTFVGSALRFGGICRRCDSAHAGAAWTTARMLARTRVEVRDMRGSPDVAP